VRKVEVPEVSPRRHGLPMIRIMSISGARGLSLATALPGQADGLHALLASSAQTVMRPRGHRLFRTGQRPQWMYRVQAGEVLVQRVTFAGTVATLQRAGPGLFVAEASLTSPRYHCEAVCRTACSLLAWPAQVLREAIDGDPGVRWAWIELLGAQARLQRLRVERLSLKTIRDRLRHLLLTEGTAQGEYRLPGTRLELAAELGVTPEALYRGLAALQAEGAIEVEGACLRWAG
jgi:CRP-like cAMP-binding protein